MKITIRNGQSWFYRMRRVLMTLCLAALTTFIGYKVVFGANGMKVWEAKKVEASTLQREIDHMVDEQAKLQRRVDGLRRGDSSLIEKEAREQLGYVKPGEVVLFEQRSKSDLKTPAVASNLDQR
ncbi:MAG TPA: septum formation initiator family protein [Bryocella sp.]|nr:septum formation initiator family protein [Bryocella sp.]